MVGKHGSTKEAKEAELAAKKTEEMAEGTEKQRLRLVNRKQLKRQAQLSCNCRQKYVKRKEARGATKKRVVKNI